MAHFITPLVAKFPVCLHDFHLSFFLAGNNKGITLSLVKFILPALEIRRLYISFKPGD